MVFGAYLWVRRGTPGRLLLALARQSPRRRLGIAAVAGTAVTAVSLVEAAWEGITGAWLLVAGIPPGAVFGVRPRDPPYVRILCRRRQRRSEQERHSQRHRHPTGAPRRMPVVLLLLSRGSSHPCARLRRPAGIYHQPPAARLSGRLCMGPALEAGWSCNLAILCRWASMS